MEIKNSEIPKVVNEFMQKDALKKASNGIGLASIAGLAVMSGWSNVFFRICSIFGLNSQAATRILREPIIGELVSVILAFFMSFLPFLVLFLAKEHKNIKNLSFEKPKASSKNVAVLIALGVAFCNLAAFLSMVVVFEFSVFGIDFPSSNAEMLPGFFGFILSLLSSAFIPALLEEFAMRGVAMGILRKYGDGFAILCTSFVFAFLHANPRQIFFAFLVGLVLGFVTVKTDSIWPAIAIHFLNNAVAVLTTYSYDLLSQELANFIYYAFVAASFIVAIVLLAVKGSEIFNKQQTVSEQTLLSEGKKYSTFLFSPTIIVFVLFALYISIFMR